MRRPASRTYVCIALATILSLSLIAGACQQSATNINTSNSNTATPTNANTSPTATPASTGATIDTKEPSKYAATMTLKIEASGNGQSISTPPLTAEFVRDGDNRSISFNAMKGEKVIYLDRADKHYIVLPNRKQYAELTPEATGFQVPSMMTPGQIVSQLKSASGYQLVGDDQWQGRPVTKYRYAGKTQTGTQQAGEVQSEAFLYVDKATGLPLRSETFLESTGSTQGRLKIVQEMTNIRLDEKDIPASIFDEPKGMSKIAPEQVRQQVDFITNAAIAIAGNLMRNMGAPSAGNVPAASPTATQTPAR